MESGIEPSPTSKRDQVAQAVSNPIQLSETPVIHSADAYDERGFDQLLRIQERHFWYLGRHRFLLRAVRSEIRRMGGERRGLQAADLGGGCGGWIRYLSRHSPDLFSELALADSSLRALELAGPVVEDVASRHRVDLLQLDWSERWDVVFLLDVLEHIEDHLTVLRQVRKALRPGGFLFVTVPALSCFWSFYDEIGHHRRRYARRDLARLAPLAGFELCRARYFMFFLSPLLLASRLRRPDLGAMTESEIRALILRTHATPPAPINHLLRLVLSLETPLGWWVPFPWGASVLGVFRRA